MPILQLQMEHKKQTTMGNLPKLPKKNKHNKGGMKKWKKKTTINKQKIF
jgi:hypothetical protein